MYETCQMAQVKHAISLNRECFRPVFSMVNNNILNYQHQCTKDIFSNYECSSSHQLSTYCSEPLQHYNYLNSPFFALLFLVEDILDARRD